VHGTCSSPSEEKKSAEDIRLAEKCAKMADRRDPEEEGGGASLQGDFAILEDGPSPTGTVILDGPGICHGNHSFRCIPVCRSGRYFISSYITELKLS